MASIIKKRKKNHDYYYLVESARVNGKPRIVHQKYLGRAEDIAQAVDENKHPANPDDSIVLEFGAVAALFDLANRLGVVNMIDQHVSKRDQGLSVGTYMLLAAINRAVNPTSKNSFGEWFSKTMLDRFLPAKPSHLTSQRFWDNMGLLTDKAMEQFEKEFSEHIVKTYGLDTDCLIYDATNFFTYVDTKSSSKIPQRGDSKEKRKDLKIVGLAMMVSPDFGIPLFHETYPGNNNDAKQFESVIDKLKSRYQSICGKPKNITLVFDKGNNSLDNIKHLRSGKWGFHVVGTLKSSQVKPLQDIEPDQFEPLIGERFEGMRVYRTTYHVYDENMTVLVTYNPDLLKGQMQGIQKNLETCTRQLQDLQHRLLEREAGRIRKGKKPTVSSVKKNVNKILQKEYMKELFDVDISPLERSVQVTFTFNESQMEYLKKYVLGKTNLYTDNHDWSNEKIVAAYRSQHHIESSFKQMKNHQHLDVRPIYHWTDQKIKVHTFYCVLALRLCSLLNRELHGQGIDISINRMLDVLADTKQVINVYKKKGKGKNKKEQQTFSLSQCTPEAKKIMETLELEKYQLEG